MNYNTINNTRLNNIQALRGMAALGVFLFHLLPVFNFLGLDNAWYEAVCSVGYIGVDVFFVISGYVMAQSSAHLSTGMDSIKSFAIKRLLRIYLGFWPMFLLMLVLYLFYQPEALQLGQLMRSFFLLNPAQEELIIPPAWSLTYELYFYLIIAMSLFLIPKNRFWIIAVMFVVSAASTLLSNQDHFFTSYFLMEFALGYFVYCFAKKIENQVGFEVSMVLLVASMIAFGAWGVNAVGMVRVITAGMVSVCLLNVILQLESRQIIFPKWLQKIGDASYTLYLLHMIVINAVMASGLSLWFKEQGMSSIFYLMILIFTIILSLLLYLSMEKPLYRVAVKKLS